MIARFVVGLTGVLGIAAGLVLIFAPRVSWRIAENTLVMSGGERIPSYIYAMGAISLLWGLMLLYAGVTRLTHFSVFVSIIGAIIGLAGLWLLVAPGSYIQAARSLYLDRPEPMMLRLSFAAGVVRMIVGYFLLIAVLRPRGQRA